MSHRQTTLLQGLDLLATVGAEIGPLDKPLVPKGGAAVIHVDHCGTDELKARWASDPHVNADALHVDAVWGEATLRQAIMAVDAVPLPPDGLAYVLASHVIEHVPDLVTWLREVKEVLSPTGVLRLAVPDKRYTFDLLRRTTLLPEVAEAYIRRRRAPSASRVLDFGLHMVHVDCGKAWRGALDADKLVRPYTDAQALELAQDAERNGAYHDVHCWVFTPSSFVDLMTSMARCGLLEMSCDWLVDTRPDTFEFFVSLRPCNDPASVLRSWEAAGATLAPPRGLKQAA